MQERLYKWHDLKRGCEVWLYEGNRRVEKIDHKSRLPLQLVVQDWMDGKSIDDVYKRIKKEVKPC